MSDGVLLLRPARQEDAAFILQLEKDGMHAHAKKLWGTWRASADLRTLDLAGHEIIILDDTPVGCMAVTWHADHMRLRKLYIAPAQQGCGIGAKVLAAKIDEASDRELPVVVSTLSPNLRAIAFYERAGFTVTATDRERIMLSTG